MGAAPAFFDRINAGLSTFSHIALAVGVAAILTTLIVRIDAWMMDLLLAINITVSALVMLVALYVFDSARLTALPTVLLITTLFRLALNVSSTRLILLDAYAGKIIESFGAIAVGGNYIVGAVVFIVLVVIQLLVITRGAERVAEVSARFTLDAMPGKQLGIDAELRAGLIKPEEAQRRRRALERESRLYGAMDGAMKFVKGDAIAGIIISIVNIVAGMAIGMLQMGMSAHEAAEVFTLLTIGDGLVSQIPALLIAFAAGLAVTRVASASTQTRAAPVARDMLDQALAHPWALAATAIIALGMAFVSGFPTAIFLVLSALLTCLAGFSFSRQARGQTAVPDDIEHTSHAASAVAPSPIAIRLHPAMARSLFDLDAAGEPVPSPDLLARLEELRDQLSNAMGIQFPPLAISIDDDARATAPESGYSIHIYDTPIARGATPKDRLIAITSAAEAVDKQLDAVPFLAPWGRGEFAAIPHSQEPRARDAGYSVYTPEQLLLIHTQIGLRRHAADLLGIQEAEQLIEELRRDRPHLVESVYQRLFQPAEITEVLQRLLREEIPIRDLRLIFESLARWKQPAKDIALVTEHVRKDLKGIISRRFAATGMVLEYYALDTDFQRQLAELVRSTAPDQPITLTIDQRRIMYDAVGSSIDPARHWTFDPVIVTPPTLRRALRTLLADAFPEISILATDEIAPSFYHRCIGRIRLMPEA
ncbi:MAG: FHIPEP family type III secretion protein [Phycisphaerales bacterium]|nr:FHIPEP family type III secretion protein [Phycisphaerales bacterium]